MTRPTAARFEKWEGLGNDFALLRADEAQIHPELVRRLCDRRFGIGADGVILVSMDGDRPRMIVYNADGSRPEMCGNGLRCVASYLAARAEREGEFVVATDAGERACSVVAIGSDRFEVSVDMGRARRGADLRVTIDGAPHEFHSIDVGNPHAITFAPYEEAEIDRIGPAVAVTPPAGTNVEFCRTFEGQDRIEVTVWERGVGRTLACGTGACAVAAAACEIGRAPFGAPIRVALPGGELSITVTPETRALRMRGPARRVFSGEVMLA
jgi:diaminopimelate epimerase